MPELMPQGFLTQTSKAKAALGKSDAEQKDFLKYQLKLERAVTRIQVAQKNTTH